LKRDRTERKSPPNILSLDGIDRLIARMPNVTRLWEHLLAAHTTTKEVGKVAAGAGVKTLAVNHFVPVTNLLSQRRLIAPMRQPGNS
jgi:ribonuclease BN (tRNA processing enzyme)